MKWLIEGLTVKKTYNQFNNCVVSVSWSCSTEKSGDSEIICRKDGETFLPNPLDSDFIEFNNLTSDLVLDWMWQNGVDKQAIEFALIAEINSQKTSSEIVKLSPPWK